MIGKNSLIFLLLVSFSAYLPANSSLPWASWQEIGKAPLTWGFWKIYDSELYSPNGQYNEQFPLALIITYNRDIDKEDLLDATYEQWQHLGYSAQQINNWKALMQQAWPDVKKQDKLIYVLDGQGQFYYQANFGEAKLYSQLDEPILAKAFLDIWLAPNTSYPKLRQRLIGKSD